ncbi:TPA: YopX family protein, partial [Campylobacter coli]
KLKDFDFRIWDGKKYINNVKGGVYIHKINDYIKCLKRNQDCYDYEFELDDLDNSNLEIELFTGFYDKNGKKIFEGDILEYTRWCEQYMEDAEHSETIYEVVCFDTNGGLYSKLLNGEFGWFFEHFMNDKNNTIEEMSIIGNIHENKELLNVRL